MRAGKASTTAQRVAARRLTFERVPAPYGDPAADEGLARDVASGVTGTSSTGMVEYLRARTAFFDRVVVGALDRGVGQVVIAAAGYDGRALRYAKPGVRWFEVDHPDTQADKRERLARLGIDVGHVTFVAADFARDDVAAVLVNVALDAQLPSLFLCEGVAVYLEREVLEGLLQALGQVAGPGSRLAISLSVATGGAGQAVRRKLFQAAVAAMGEPARTVLSADDADALLERTGWRVEPASDRARAAGLVLAELSR